MFNFKLKAQSQLPRQLLTQKVFELSQQHQLALKNIAADMQSYLTASLSVPVQKQGGRVVRSAPGQPPRIDSGQLASNSKVSFTTSANSANIRIAAGNTPYAKYLEYGSANIAPRPFLLPTLNKFKEAIKTSLKNIWRYV